MGSITRAVLVDDLRALGIASDDVVLVHSSLSSIGHVDGGAPAVVEAFRSVLGDRGPWSRPRSAARSPTRAGRWSPARPTPMSGQPVMRCPSSIPGSRRPRPGSSQRQSSPIPTVVAAHTRRRRSPRSAMPPTASVETSRSRSPSARTHRSRDWSSWTRRSCCSGWVTTAARCCTTSNHCSLWAFDVIGSVAFPIAWATSECGSRRWTSPPTTARTSPLSVPLSHRHRQRTDAVSSAERRPRCSRAVNTSPSREMTSRDALLRAETQPATARSSGGRSRTRR